MTLARLSAGLVVVGCLVAGALGSGCSETGDSSAVGGDSQSAQGPSVPPSTTVTAGPNVPIPTATVTTGPNIPAPTSTIGPVTPPQFRPRIDDPQKACEQLFDGSTFQGYLVEVVGERDCPNIFSSKGVWKEDPGDCMDSVCVAKPAVGKAFYAASAPEVTCRYLPPNNAVVTQDIYDSFKAALGYPSQVSRDIQGILCVKPGGGPLPAGPPPDDAAPIPVCRKCSQANASKVMPPTLVESLMIRARAWSPWGGRVFGRGSTIG